MSRRASTILSALFLSATLGACSPASAPSGKDASAAEQAVASAPDSGEGTAVADQVTAERHIAYEIDVALTVGNVPLFDVELTELAREHGGFLSQVTLDEIQGEQGSGHWELRVPATGQVAVLDALGELGDVHRVEQRAEDVTAQVLDVEARLQARRAAEGRLLEIMTEGGADLEAVLATERELARVRESIEVLEASERAVKDRVALTTIRIDATQAPGEVELALGPMAARTLEASWFGLSRFFVALFLLVVALLPWSPLLAGLIFIGLRLQRRTQPRPQSPAGPAPRPPGSARS